MEGSSVGEAGGNSIPQDPHGHSFHPCDPAMQRVKSQNSSRDRKERAGWNYISSRGLISKSSQRNQRCEDTMASLTCELIVPET